MSGSNINIKCYKFELGRSLKKDDRLCEHPDECEKIVSSLVYTEKYEDAINAVLEYFKTAKRRMDEQSTLKGITKFYKQGDLFRPQFSGSRKTYEPAAIGLTISIEYCDATRDICKISPLNKKQLIEQYNYTNVFATLPKKSLIGYATWFIELSQVYPFAVIRVFKALYERDSGKLQNLLSKIYKDYSTALKETLKHLKVPSKPSISITDLKMHPSDKQPYLVVYRCQRAFASTVMSPGLLNDLFSTGIRQLILSNTLSYMITFQKPVAYYYASVLNYLVKKVKESYGGGFVLNQYGRPIQALKKAGLEWNDETWQHEVADKVEMASEKIRKAVLKFLGLPEALRLYEVVDENRDIFLKEALKDVAKSKDVPEIIEHLYNSVPEVRDVFNVIDKHVDYEALKEALTLVVEKR